MTKKTYSVKPSQITRQWYLLSADADSLGRVATKAAELLMGKHKPQFSHHIDCGDYVVIINSNQLKVSGQKPNQKQYYSYSGFPGGLRTRSLKDIMASDSTEVIIKSVRGMLPVNKLRPARLKRLKVYTGADHPHTAQQLTKLNLGDANER